MKIQLLKYFNNHGPPILISFNPNLIIDKKCEYKQDLIKVEIKTQPGKDSINTILIYILHIKTGLTKTLLSFLILLNKTTNCQNLTKGPHIYDQKKSPIRRGNQDFGTKILVI